MRPRRAVAADLDAIVALWAGLAREHHARDPRFHPASDEGLSRYRAWMAPAVHDPQRLVLVVDGPQGPVGFLHAEIRAVALSLGARPSGYITDLCVDPPHRRQGLGRVLVEHSLAVFAELELERAGLAVAEHNPAGLAFWRALGFEPYTRTLLKTL